MVSFGQNWRVLKSEGEIAAAAKALIRYDSGLFSDLFPLNCTVDPETVETIRSDILAGGDPLGDAMCIVRSAKTRRKIGQTLTPFEIVDFMVRSAAMKGIFETILDPGIGSGRFLRRAAAAFPKSRLIGIDADPLSVLISKANLDVLGLSDRAELLIGDYRNTKLPEHGRTLFIGNPPYVRHHDIESSWKDWYADAMNSLGAHRVSKLAGLHMHFFVRTGQIIREGDLGLFVTAAEWLDASYGEALRTLLRGRLGGISVTNIAADSEPFPGTQATAAITSFSPRDQENGISFGFAKSVHDLDEANNRAITISRDKLTAKKWSRLTSFEIKPRGNDGGRIGDFFKVSRGQVTGNNKVFVVGPDTPTLPNRFLLPCVTGADELFWAADHYDYRLDHRTKLKSVVSLTGDFSNLDSDEFNMVSAFIAWGEERGAHLSYTAKTRKPWWKVQFHTPPPIIVTYMARRPPVFVRNLSGARILNISHGLRPKTEMDDAQIDQFVTRLNEAAIHAAGRTYAGGLIKYEPSDIAEIPLMVTERVLI